MIVPVVPILAPSSDELLEFARSLSLQLALPIVSARSNEPWALEFVDGDLTLLHDPRRKGNGHQPSDLRVTIDFAREQRHLRGRAKRQPLFRAIGPSPRRVFDATTGFARDAYHLASSGYHVVGVERSAPIAALLQDARRRALADAKIAPTFDTARLSFRSAEATDELVRLTEPPATVYIDPMFPQNPREKSLPKKEIQCLRELVGPTDETELAELLDVARRIATDRVVIKRPTTAPSIPGIRHRIETKLVCYDVYSTSAHSGP